jgi:hypothetical protein
LYFGGTGEGPFVAISKPGKGKAAFIGDSSPIEDNTPKYRRENGRKKKTHPGWTSAGNAAVLSINIVNWLATPESYEGFDGVNHAKGVETPVAMADVEKEQSKAEPWTQPAGFDPWAPSTYQGGAYGSPHPAGAGQSGGGSGGSSGSGGSGSGIDFVKKSGGAQVGQVKQPDGSWSKTGYTKLTGPGVILAVVRVTDTDQNMSIRVRVGNKKKNKDVRGIASGWRFIEQMVEAEPGDIAAAVKDGKILGAALVDENKKVKIAVKEDETVQLVIYDKEGKKK